MAASLVTPHLRQGQGEGIGQPGQDQGTIQNSSSNSTAEDEDRRRSSSERSGESGLESGMGSGEAGAGRRRVGTQRPRIMTFLSTNSSEWGDASEDFYSNRLRRRLKFFFMNPYEKWKARRQFPFKLALQVVKIVFVTLQLILFGSLRTDHINYLQQTRASLRHIFIGNWSSTADVLVYPPAAGPFSVYTQADFLASLAFAASQYYELDDIALSKFYKSDAGARLCVDSWRTARVTNISFYTFHYEYDIQQEPVCKPLAPCESVLLNKSLDSSVRMKHCFELLNHNWTDMIGGFISFYFIHKGNIIAGWGTGLKYFKFELKFDLASVHVPPKHIADSVSCYQMKPRLSWADEEQSGQMRITLEMEAIELTDQNCTGNLTPSNVPWLRFIEVLDFLVLLLVFASFILCTRALIKGQLLKNKTKDYFRKMLNEELGSEETGRFLNYWYVMIVLNDCLICFGTLLKMTIEFSRFNEDVFTSTTILLGVGTLLVWCGLLRYLGFFAHYNVLMQTMKRAAPNVLRFTVCAGLLYMGFLLCGWIVLGPYSIKFKDVLSASECLFALINGDDMFATFFTISDHSPAVKWFARIYLYVFISIFIYVVLSLFISIILSAYDVVKELYGEGESGGQATSGLDAFLAECSDTPCPERYGDTQESLWDAFKEALHSCLRSCPLYGRRRRSEYQEIGGRGNSAVLLSEESDHE